MHFNSLIFIVLAIALYLFFKIESYFEKLFLVKSIVELPVYEEKKSLNYFKYGLWFIIFIGSLEFSLNKYKFTYINIIGFFLVLIGVLLRIKAISTLKDYWSFNITIYPNHKYINSGIYKYLKHPAYIGNIYIFGTYLFIGTYITCAISLVFIIVFGFWRSNIENKKLKLLNQQQ